MIVQKITFTDRSRSSSNIDQFYYEGLENKLQGRLGTGVRNLSADFIRQGKILDRFLMLNKMGNSLEVFTIFKDRNCFEEFNDHPINLAAKKFFSDKEWDIEAQIYHLNDYLNVRDRLNSLKSVI